MKKIKSTKRLFVVELVLPKDMTDKDMCSMILSALKAEVGALHPEDPGSKLDTRAVVVKGFSRKLASLQNELKRVRKLVP